MSNLIVVLFTRDLRLHDQPALSAAAERGERVLPLFVLDDRMLATFGAPNRVAFLLDSLGDLRRSLEACGGGLAIVAATSSPRRSGSPSTMAPTPSTSPRT